MPTVVITNAQTGEVLEREMTPAELALLVVSEETLRANARSERNALLTSSDWTQVADAPVNQATWATYRQALRDITDQEGFPENIDWPTAPT